MYKIKHFFSKTVMFSTLLVFICTLSFVGCSKEENEPSNGPLDEVILNSPELEEYIIAGADFQRSQAIFTAYLNMIDLSTLEVTYDAKGNKVVHLPAIVASLNMEKKVENFNKKKESLRNKFPQFTSFREGVSKEYFRQSMQRSVNVRGELLKLGINSIPLVKSGNEVVLNTNDCSDLDAFLDSWVNSSSYVEVYILYYMDGGIDIIKTEQAQSGTAGPLTFQIQGEHTYYNSRLVYNVGHTHTDEYGGSNPTEPDDERANDYFNLPGTTRFIYYNGSYIYY